LVAAQCCAFLEVDGKKMSKSEGNFLTIADGVERFSGIELGISRRALSHALLARS
jgi:cysteinyl-tRNA synthetase